MFSRVFVPTRFANAVSITHIGSRKRFNYCMLAERLKDVELWILQKDHTDVPQIFVMFMQGMWNRGATEKQQESKITFEWTEEEGEDAFSIEACLKILKRMVEEKELEPRDSKVTTTEKNVWNCAL